MDYPSKFQKICHRRPSKRLRFQEEGALCARILFLLLTFGHQPAVFGQSLEYLGDYILASAGSRILPKLIVAIIAIGPRDVVPKDTSTRAGVLRCSRSQVFRPSRSL
jgi:hypothetical protein